jgi:hypothetical protein
MVVLAEEFVSFSGVDQNFLEEGVKTFIPRSPDVAF